MSSADIGIIVVIFAVVQTLSIFVLKEILKKTIAFEFRKREQAVMVAELFAEWDKENYDRARLNQLAWTVTLWLPDDLALTVNKKLTRTPGAKQVKQILVEIKSFLQGKESKMDPNQIAHFGRK